MGKRGRNQSKGRDKRSPEPETSKAGLKDSKPQTRQEENRRTSPRKKSQSVRESNKTLNRDTSKPKYSKGPGQPDAVVVPPPQLSKSFAGFKSFKIPKIQHDSYKSGHQDKREDTFSTLVDRALLKAKRRLPEETQAVNKPKPLIAEEPSRELLKPRSNSTEKSGDAKKPPQPKQVLIADLPDYEDGLDDDEAEAEKDNTMPRILKMVSEAKESLPCTPNAAESMDVDVELPQTPPKQIVVVPDTNIWINNLDVINSIVNGRFSKPVFIVVPWMVLQELDVTHHKNRGRTTTAAIKMIHTFLTNQNPRIKTQKAYEAALSKLTFDELVADDSILNCVFQNLKANNNVIFVSNDINLLNKALVHGVVAVSGNKCLSKLDEVMGSSASFLQAPPTPISPTGFSMAIVGSGSQNNFATTSIFPIASPILWKDLKSSIPVGKHSPPDFFLDETEDIEMEDDSPVAPKVRAMPGRSFSSAKPPTLYHRLNEILVKTFSHIIKRKMIEDYGMGGWEYALKIKPPWSLESSLKCMITHWIANFSFVFERRGQFCLQNLTDCLKRYKYSARELRSKIEEEILENAVSLFNYISREYESLQPISECKQILLELSQRP